MRKQFSKTSSFQKSKEDADYQKTPKVNEGSTHHGECLTTKQYNKHSYQKNSRCNHVISPKNSACTFFLLFSLSRTPHLITRWASPPAGSGALLLEWPSRWHVRGLPRRQAPLLCPHHGWGPLLPCQHTSGLHGSKQTGEFNIMYESPLVLCINFSLVFCCLTVLKKNLYYVWHAWKACELWTFSVEIIPLKDCSLTDPSLPGPKVVWWASSPSICCHFREMSGEISVIQSCQSVPHLPPFLSQLVQ